MSLFDHIGFHSKDVGRSFRFYESCMRALDLEVMANSAKSFFVSGGERAPVPFIWISARTSAPSALPHDPGNHLHMMFTALSRDMVDAFHAAALAGGGSHSDAPGYQGPQEMGYYAALVFDPDGNTVEAGFRQRRG
ncbi:glyoxalase [Paraburkholderia aspalathi]|nr:glyoxalase [Paraburkholderia aspalathi]